MGGDCTAEKLLIFFTLKSCQIFASPCSNAMCTCKSPSGLQGRALGPNIQVRTRSVPGMAGVLQVSFILSRQSPLLLSRIEIWGCELLL